MEIGDIVETINPNLYQKGPITEINGDRVVFQITEEKVTLDFSDYGVDPEDAIVESHFVMDCPMSHVRLVK